MRTYLVGLVLTFSVLATAGTSAALFDQVAIVGGLMQEAGDDSGAYDLVLAVTSDVAGLTPEPVSDEVAAAGGAASDFVAFTVTELQVKRSVVENTTFAVANNAALMANTATLMVVTMAGNQTSWVQHCFPGVGVPVPATWAEVRERCGLATGLVQNLTILINAIVAMETAWLDDEQDLMAACQHDLGGAGLPEGVIVVQQCAVEAANILIAA